jgi:hypothetical protein
VARATGVVAILCALAVPLAAGTAHADVSRIGVVVASRGTLTEKEADGLAGRLGQTLQHQLEVEVVAGVEARRRMPKGGVPKDCAAQLDCLREMAHRLRSDELLLLFIARNGPRVQIGVTWSDPDIAVGSDRPSLVMPALVGAEADRVLAAAPSLLLPHASPRGSRPEPERGEEIVLEPPPRFVRRLTVPVMVTGALALAAAGAGAGFAVVARAEYNELEADGCHRDACPWADRRVDQMERRALVADILLGTAAAAAATSAILYFTTPKTIQRVEVGAATSPGGAVFSLGGSF